MASEVGSQDQEELLEGLSIEVHRFRPRRTQRYRLVNVLLLFWENSDLPSKEEAQDLGNTFRNYFNFSVHLYEIPSQDSQRELNRYIANFLSLYGDSENLVLVHYGGHGGSSPGRSPCTWAAQRPITSPSLDWSTIQPQLLSAGCDVTIFLDCCYAGLAARLYAQNSVEFLAATDKDQLTPAGDTTRPSFTRVLINEIIGMLNEDGVVTVPGLQSRMSVEKAGLTKQPFYVELTKGSAGQIQLRRLENGLTVESSQNVTVSNPSEKMTALPLILSLFRPLDSNSQKALARWMTKDSPLAIKDVFFVKEGLSQAQAVNDLAHHFLHPAEAISRAQSPFLSTLGHIEVTRLLKQLKDVISAPAPENISDDEAMKIARSIKQQSAELITVVEDCLAGLSTEALRKLTTWDLSATKDIRSRIALRLALLNGEAKPSVVKYQDRAQPEQRFRDGKQDDTEVLVEYWYHDSTEKEQHDRIEIQVARVSALLAEPKPIAFRALLGRGYVDETLYGQKFGFVYDIPEERRGHRHSLISILIQEKKVVPLEVRIRMASVLCEAMLHLHSVGWFHKAIKSENVLVFTREAPESFRAGDILHEIYDLENPYFVGFDCSRPAAAESRTSADFRSKQNLYRHPKRWGQPVRFERHHDLYALGLLLYEIGRWRMLPTMGKKSKDFENIKNPENLRDSLLGSGYVQLAHCTGTKYAKAARFCLERRERDWDALEEWQFQRVIRENVLSPLREW